MSETAHRSRSAPCASVEGLRRGGKLRPPGAREFSTPREPLHADERRDLHARDLGSLVPLALHAPASRPALHDVGMVEEPVEQRADGGRVAEELDV